MNRMFNVYNLKVFHKILLLVIISLLAFITIGVTGFYNTYEMKNNNEKMYNKNLLCTMGKKFKLCLKIKGILFAIIYRGMSYSYRMTL